MYQYIPKSDLQALQHFRVAEDFCVPLGEQNCAASVEDSSDSYTSRWFDGALSVLGVFCVVYASVEVWIWGWS